MRAQTQRVAAVRTAPGRTIGCGNASGAGRTTCLSSLSIGPVPPAAATRTGPAAPFPKPHNRFAPLTWVPALEQEAFSRCPTNVDSSIPTISNNLAAVSQVTAPPHTRSHSSHRLLTQALIVLKISEAPAEELCTARHFDRIALQRRPSHARSARFLHAASSGGCIALCAGVVLLAMSLIAPSPRRAAAHPPARRSHAHTCGDMQIARAHMRRCAAVEASGAPPTASCDMHCTPLAQDLQRHAPAPGRAQSPPL